MASPLSPAQIITITLTIFLAINGAIGVYVNNTLNSQSTDIREIRTLVIAHMNSQYGRAEAEHVHASINEHIDRIEARDKMMEVKLNTHLQSDAVIHKKKD
jgi:hypothetical protein